MVAAVLGQGHGCKHNKTTGRTSSQEALATRLMGLSPKLSHCRVEELRPVNLRRFLTPSLTPSYSNRTTVGCCGTICEHCTSAGHTRSRWTRPSSQGTKTQTLTYQVLLPGPSQSSV